MLDLRKKVLYATLVEKGKLGISLEELAKTSGLSKNIISDILSRCDSVSIDDKEVVRVLSVSSLLVEAWLDGVNVVEVALRTGWKEFEEFVSEVLGRFGYSVVRNIRFKAWGRHFQVDVLGALRPLVLVVDCKRWSRARTYHLKQAALAQAARAEAIARYPPSVLRSLTRGWKKPRVVPVVVSLLRGSVKTFEGIPIVPLPLFPSFLKELPTHLDEVLHYEMPGGIRRAPETEH